MKADRLPAVFVMTDDDLVHILTRQRYRGLKRLAPGAWDNVGASDLVLLDTSCLRLHLPRSTTRGDRKEAVIDEILRASPICRIVLLTNKNIDLELCLDLWRDHEIAVDDYLPANLASYPGLPDLRGEPGLGLVRENPEWDFLRRNAYLLQLSWRKLSGYLDYRDALHRSDERDPSSRTVVIGNLLEDFTLYCLTMIEGFVCTKGLPNSLGQIDVLVRNESPSPFWSKAGMFFAVECKNRATHVDGDVVDKLLSFARRRSGTVHLVMVFHTADRLTEPARRKLLSERLGSVSLLEFNRPRLRRLMEGAEFDKPAELREMIDERLKQAMSNYVLAYDSDR